MTRRIPRRLPHIPIIGDTLRMLAEAEARGIRELILVGEYTLTEAAGLALQLPPVEDPDSDAPRGWGMFPPNDYGPAVLARPGVRDARGNPVPTGKHGVVCCMWRTAKRPDRVVHRLSFPGDASTPALFPVDVYDDQIASELVLYHMKAEGREPLPAVHPGWALCRLDPAPAEAVEQAIRAAGLRAP